MEFESNVREIFLENQDEETFFKPASELLKKEIGYKLLTFTVVHPNQKYIQRIFSSNTEVYPLGGIKDLPDNYWAELTINQKKSFIGNNRKEIEKYFFDHETITSLGCESILNQVVVFNNKTIGTINLLNVEDHFTKSHLNKMTLFSKYASPFFLSSLINMVTAK